jgi:hypothetical protein
MAIGGAAYAAGSGAATRAAAEQAQYQQMANLQAQTPQVAPAATAAQDRVAQLKDLAELKAQGILTDDEFEREKQRILSGQ